MTVVSGGDGVVLMPMWKRVTITVIQLAMTLITAGVIIGYGQLNPILVDSKVYHSKCGADTPADTVCTQQQLALDQLFNVGASISIFVQAPSGIILDFLGPRVTCWAGLALFIPGCFIFAFADVIHHVDAYMIGFQLLAAGGPFVFISSLPVSQLWPDKKAMILMLVNGVYGGGAFVFFLFSLLYENAHVSMRTLFIGYGILGGFIVVIAGFVWPWRSFASAIQIKEVDPIDTTSTNTNEKDISPVQRPATTKDIILKSLKDVCTVDFIFLAFFVMFIIFKSNFFLSTYNNQIALYMSDTQQTEYNNVFGVLLPLLGMLAGPIGLVFDKFGPYFALVLVILLSTVSSICGMMVGFSMTVYYVFQIIRLVVFSVYFPMIYGVWAFVIISRYGSTNFGVLYGVIAILAGILNISAATPLNNFALRHHSYFTTNLLLASIGAVFIFYPLLAGILQYCRRNKGGYQPLA